MIAEFLKSLKLDKEKQEATTLEKPNVEVTPETESIKPSLQDDSKAKCQICDRCQHKYKCPKCQLLYCTINCYNSDKH